MVERSPKNQHSIWGGRIQVKIHKLWHNICKVIVGLHSIPQIAFRPFSGKLKNGILTSIIWCTTYAKWDTIVCRRFSVGCCAQKGLFGDRYAKTLMKHVLCLDTIFNSSRPHRCPSSVILMCSMQSKGTRSSCWQVINWSNRLRFRNPSLKFKLVTMR